MANVFDRLDRIERGQTGKKDMLSRLDRIQPVKSDAEVYVPSRKNKIGLSGDRYGSSAGRGFAGEKTTLGQRITDTVKGGVKGSGAAYTNLVGTLYDAAKEMRKTGEQRDLEKSRTNMDKAQQMLTQMEQAAPGTYTEEQLKKQRKAVEDYRAEYDLWSRVSEETEQGNVKQGIYSAADRLADSGARDVMLAKAGLGGVGQTLVGAGASMTQTALDGLVGAATGTGMLSFGARAFGGGVQEARRENPESTLGQQIGYGAASAAKEIITEKLFNISLPFAKAYGGGTADDMVERAIRTAVDKFADTPQGKKALGGVLTFGAGAVTEGLEEFLGDWIEWGLRMPKIYGGDVATAQETLSDSLTDFLVGAASGAMGGVISPSTYNYDLGTQTTQEGPQMAQEAPAQAAPAAQEDGTMALLRQAAMEMQENGSVSSRTADRIMGDSAAMEELGVESTASKSQQRRAVKNAVESYAQRDGQDVLRQAAMEMQEDTEGTAEGGAQDILRQAAMEMQEEQAQPAPRQENVREQLRAAARDMGENGTKALAESYDGSADAAEYYAGFANYYEAGISGLDMGKVQSQYAGQLTEAQKFAAYSAGQNDAAASLALEREGVKSATVYGDEAGFVQSEHSARLSKETIRTFDNLARAAGVKIQMEADTGEGGANGWYANGIIHIAADAKNPGIEVAKHEITHRMQEMAPEAYRKYRDYAVNALAERDGGSFALVERYKRRYADQARQNLTTEQAMDEIAADFTEALVVDPAQFESLAKKDRSVARKVLDAVRDFLRKIKALFKGNKSAQNQAAADAFGVSIDTLEEAAHLWTEALKATSQQAASLQGKADGATMDAVKLSLKDMSEGERAALLQYKSSESYKINAKLRDGTALTAAEQKMVADLDAALEKLPVHEGTVYRRLSFDMEGQEALDAFLAEHADGDIVLYEAYTSSSMAIDGYPVSGELTATLVIDSRTGRDMAGIGNNFESEVVFPRGCDFIVERVTQDTQGNPVIYMKEDAENGIGQLHSEERLQKMQQLQEKGERRDSLHKVSETDTARGAGKRNLPGVRGEGTEKVKFSLKNDSKGRELTAGQQEYFKDSKVLDKDGQLKVMYRGGSGDFTVFDRRKSSYANLYGRGFYFTDSEAHAMQYGNPRAFYLNITNPVSTDETTITRSQMRKFLKAVAENEDDYSFENYGYGATVDSVLKSVYGKSDFAMLYDVSQTAIGDMVAAVELFNEINGTDFDGLILDTETVTFRSEQAKNIDNRNPTSDPDIRRSLKGENTLKENAALRQENDLLRERVDYWKGQTKRTTRVTTDKKAVAKAAGQLIENFGADIAVEDIQGDLQSLYDYLASGYDGKDELTYTEARRRAENIARTLVENAVAVDSDMYEQYSDLRNYLRTTKLVYNKYYHGDIPDFNDFRRRNFGRLNLGTQGTTNIAQVYQEMSSLWPEFFNDQAHSHPSDQLLHIAEVLDNIYDITEYNPFSHDMDQAVTGAANEIMELFFDLPQTRKTFADRQAAKLDAAKAKGRQQVQQVREQRDAKLAALREQNQERVQRAIARERETRARQLNALKDRYAARDAKGREQRAARELRGKIVRHAKTLSQKLLHPSDKQHIPESLRGAVAAMLESINLESQYSISEDGKRTKSGDGTPTKRTEAFRALKEQYAKIASEGGDIVIDPSLLGSDAEGIQGSFDAVIAMKDTKLADMNAQQLATVWQVVKAVEHSVNTAGKVLSKAKYARTADWAQALSLDSGSRRAKTSLTKNHALIDLETPYTHFSHYGEAGKAIYRMLRDAQDQQQLMVNHVAEEVRKIVDPKTVKKLEETTRTFTTERGEELTLSTAQIMELYELTKRKQAHDHLLKGGVVQPEVKSAKIRRGTDSILLTAGDLANITKTLTPEQVKIADGLQGLTTGLLADYGNRASMDAYGYKKFTEKDYWPIKSAKEGLHSNIEKGGNNTRSIKNIGMAKTTMPHASNALDLAGIFTTFSNHAADMTDYASWLCTMEDINRLFNYQFRDEEGNLTGKTIKGLLDRVGGPGSQKYWHNLMEDIQNGINAPGDSPMWDIAGKTIGGFKGAAVGANARVVIQQPTAFFRAAAVLDPGDMVRGLARGATKGNGWKKALKYSPIAMRKDAGGFDISSPYQMSETLFDNRTGVRKLNDALSAPAGMADAVTWGKLWNACEWATARDHQGLAKGSEAFYKQTAKLFAEVIDQTQVVDGVLQRSNIMRSSNAVVKQATSFMGEPIMSLNLLMRSYDQVRYEQNAKKRGKAIKTLGRAATALVVTNVVNALVQSVIDAMRDDDEDKKYWERFRAAFTGISGDEESAWEKAWNAVMEGNVGSNMNPLGQIPFVKDALSIIQGYEVSRTEMEIVTDLIQAGQTAIQSMDGQGKKTRAYAIKGLLAAGAKLFGVPVSNMTRDLWGLIRTAAVETDNIPVQYEMEKAIYNLSNEGNKGRYYDIMYRALEQGDLDSYHHIREDLMAHMALDGKSMDAAMRERYNKAVKADPKYTLPAQTRDLIGSRDKTAPAKEKEETFGAEDLGSKDYRAFTEQRASEYRSMADSLENDPTFRSLNAESRDKVLEAAYSLAQETALADNSGGQYEVESKWMAQADDAEKAGIEDWEYVLFHAAYEMAESTKVNGKIVKGESKSDHVREWLEDYDGLTERQREFLWGTVYKSEW